MKVTLEPVTEENFWDFFDAVVEDNGESAMPHQTRVELARWSAFEARDDVIRLPRLGDGRCAGYLEAQRRVTDGEWEVGIYLMEGCRGRGVGSAALPAFLAEIAAIGVSDPIARVELGNDASRALLERCGATLEERRTIGFDEGRELAALGREPTEEDLAMMALKRAVQGERRDVWVYRFRLGGDR